LFSQPNVPQVLLKHGADPLADGGDGRSPLDLLADEGVEIAHFAGFKRRFTIRRLLEVSTMPSSSAAAGALLRGAESTFVHSTGSRWQGKDLPDDDTSFRAYHHIVEPE
jgi:predicted Fe-Mo cluster-binding NifX family protein